MHLRPYRAANCRRQASGAERGTDSSECAVRAMPAIVSFFRSGLTGSRSDAPSADTPARFPPRSAIPASTEAMRLASSSLLGPP